MGKTVRVLCVGDVVGSQGCDFLRQRLSRFKKENAIDFTVVNGENSAVGNGMTPSSCEHILTSGADVITGGNHSFKRREIYDYLENSHCVLRPVNYNSNVWGKGAVIVDKTSYKIGVVSLMGNAYLDSYENAFSKISTVIDEIRQETPIIIIDFHAEATAEKKAMGYFLDGKVSAVAGTHTHIQTSDCQILKNGTGYITDLGMTGPEESVLGVEKEIIIEKFRNGLAPMFKTAETPCFMQGCIFEIDVKSGRVLTAQSVTVR